MMQRKKENDVVDDLLENDEDNGDIKEDENHVNKKVDRNSKKSKGKSAKLPTSKTVVVADLPENWNDASHVIATNFQTVAAANNYWRS